MFDWFFAPETSRVLLTTTLGSLAAIFSAVIASRNVSKTIKNQNKGLPPELLRLEKIQQILSNHDSSSNLREVDISDLIKEYKKSIHKSVLESKISAISLQDDLARQKLLNLPDKITDDRKFPNLNSVRGSRIDSVSRTLGFSLGFIATIVIVFAFILAIVSAPVALSSSEENKNTYILEILPSIGFILTLCSLFLILSRIMVNRWSLLDIETDLIVRNIYQHNSEFYTGNTKAVIENSSEFKKRIIFENSRKFARWSRENPDKSSWDYGFTPESPLNHLIINEAIPSQFTLADGRLILVREFPFVKRGRKFSKIPKITQSMKSDDNYYI